jgi:hypothetical protein
MLYSAQGADGGTSTGYAVSLDGVQWVKLDFIDGLDGTVAGVTKEDGTYRLWYYRPATEQLWLAEGTSSRGIDLQPSVLDFGRTRLDPDQPSVRTVTITNTGDVDLRIDEISLGATPDEVFALPEAPSVPVTLEPGARLALDVEFKPSTIGSYEGELVVRSDDPSYPRSSVLLEGTGSTCSHAADANCDAFISRSELDAFLDAWYAGQVTTEHVVEVMNLIRSQ